MNEENNTNTTEELNTPSDTTISSTESETNTEQSTETTSTDKTTTETTSTEKDNTSTVEPNTASNVTTTTQNSTTSTTDTTTTGATGSNVTAANTRTNTVPKLTYSAEGKMYIDGQAATNDQLQSYFDYTKYEDKTAASMVEGIFKSDTVTINGTTYNVILNENGEMVSTDGTQKLTQDQIKKYLGDKGFEALVCKTTKEVTIDENGTLSIKDRNPEVVIKIDPTATDTNTSNNTSNNASNKSTDSSSKLKAPTGGGSGGSGGGGGGYSGGGGGGGNSGGGGGDNSRGGSSDSSAPKADKVKSKATPVIKVDFGGLEAIRDSINSLKGQLAEVSDDYSSTISGLSNNGDAWDGVDKDKYISQKQTYSSNLEQVSSTLGEFASYLDTCLSNYQTLEQKLAEKEIS